MNVTKRILKNLLGDVDKDGTSNMFDCEVNNTKKQGVHGIAKSGMDRIFRGIERNEGV